MSPNDPWGTLTICERGGAGLYAGDLGLTVRYSARAERRFGWAQVSRFADGSGLTQERRDRYWVLHIVLRTGEEVPVPCTRESPDTVTLTAVRQAAARYGIPAELAGLPMENGRPADTGFYQDPSGQAGMRYWDGRQWSRLLPPDLSMLENVRPSAVSWSALPMAEGPWSYPAAVARRLTICFAAIAAVSATLLTGALMSALSRSGATHHGHRTGSSWNMFWFGALAALAAFGLWRGRSRFRKLDEAANSFADTV
jgi:hypothetical protein